MVHPESISDYEFTVRELGEHDRTLPLEAVKDLALATVNEDHREADLALRKLPDHLSVNEVAAIARLSGEAATYGSFLTPTEPGPYAPSSARRRGQRAQREVLASIFKTASVEYDDITTTSVLSVLGDLGIRGKIKALKLFL